MILTFTIDTLTNQDWKLRQAGAIAFECMIEQQEESHIKPIIGQGLVSLIDITNDKSKTVSESALKSIVKISEFFPELLLEMGNFATNFDKIIIKLDQDFTFSRQVCFVLSNIAKILSKYQSNPLNQNLNVVVERLFRNALRKDQDF